jgi:hypothetical protein
LSKEPVNGQEEIWNIVKEHIRNNYAATGHRTANQPVRMHNECICMIAKNHGNLNIDFNPMATPVLRTTK